MPKKPLAYRGDEPFVFVSYAHADAGLAYPIISGLQERGMRIWFDDGLDVGDIWEDVIPDHVEQCAAMLCLVSTRFTDSKNCKNEIRYASELNKGLLILHLETGELPRHIRFHYSAIHVLRLSDYSDRGRLLDKLSATEKLRCCLGEVKGASPEPEESPEELYQKGDACFAYGTEKEAVKWFRKAADLEHPRAMATLGFCYDIGIGVSQSYEEAVKWYSRAANKGDAWAMCNLGECYEKGNGIPQSWAAAVAWYRRAADKGHAPAMHILGDCYANGRGVAKDQKRAEYWRNKANQSNT